MGYMLQAMCGALLQFVPVSTGGNIWRPKLVAVVVHPCAGAGGIAAGIGLHFGSGRCCTKIAGLMFAAVILGGYFDRRVGGAVAHAGAGQEPPDVAPGHIRPIGDLDPRVIFWR